MRAWLGFVLTLLAPHVADADEKVDSIRAMLREENVVAAEAAARALVADRPADAEAQALLAAVCVAQGDADAAVEAAEKAVELEPKNGERYRQLGDVYGFAARKAGAFARMRWAKRCRGALEKAVQLEPNNIEARSSLMGYYQQAPGFAGGSTEKAFEQAAAIKRLDARRGGLALALLYIGEKRYAEAFAELAAVLQSSPDDYSALFQFGRVAAITGEQVDRGVAALEKCLTLTPPANAPGHDAAHWRLGNIWEKRGDKRAARAAYEAALAINPAHQPSQDGLKRVP